MNKTIFTILLIFHALAIYAENENKKPFNKATEKVFVQTDRDIYLINENIWFTASCFIGDHIHNNISNILYIEIYNNTKEFRVKKKFRIKNGKATGMIKIPKEFDSENYALRAYTQFSKNFSHETYFTKVISIINPTSNITISPYKPEVKKDFRNSLPFHISSKKEKDYINLEIDKNNLTENHTNFFTLETLSNDLNLISTNHLSLVTDKKQLRLPYSKLCEGINYFVLKSEDNKIAGIHAFYKKSSRIKLRVQTNKKNYENRDRVELIISDQSIFKDSLKDVSVSVVKKGTQHSIKNVINYIKNDPTLLGSFLLSTNNTAKLSDEQLNSLMKQYNSILSKKYSNYVFGKNIQEIWWVPEIRDVSISGIAYTKSTNTPVSNLPVFISSFNNNPQLHVYKTTQNGDFIFSLNNLIDSQNLFICANSNLGNDIVLRINNDFVRKYPNQLLAGIQLDSTCQELIEEMYINNQANTIFKSGTNTLNNINKQLPFIFNNPDKTYETKDFVFTSSLEVFFREIVSCVNVRNRKGHISLGIIDRDEKMVYFNPLILVDNIPVFDVNEAMSIPPSVIESIGIYRQSVVLNNMVLNGVIMLNTTTDDFGGIKLPENAVFLDYQTISDHYEFVSPEYKSEIKKQNRKADFRTLLYWNPDIKFSKNKNISFYTSDHCSEYEIIVRGYTKDAKECYGNTVITVGK